MIKTVSEQLSKYTLNPFLSLSYTRQLPRLVNCPCLSSVERPLSECLSGFLFGHYDIAVQHLFNLGRLIDVWDSTKVCAFSQLTQSGLDINMAL